MTTATHARFVDHDRGDPDPRTATCTVHAVGAPTAKDTKATNTAKPLPDGVVMNCTVCGTALADLIGQIVHDWKGSSEYLYAGPGEHDYVYQLEFGIGRSGPSILRCIPEHVAPATVPLPDKDPRITVVKRTREEIPHVRFVTKAGKWELSLPDQSPSYFDTKREAQQVGRVRVAILDYQASRVPV